MTLDKFTEEEIKQIFACVQSVLCHLEHEHEMFGEVLTIKKNYDLITLETILIKFKMM
jgi:hypothetical protein